MFLSICSSYAEGVGADTVWYGAAQVDSLAGYWDGSEEFVDMVNKVTDLNRENRINIEAPLLEMSKAEIIKEANKKIDVRFLNEKQEAELLEIGFDMSLEMVQLLDEKK